MSDALTQHETPNHDIVNLAAASLSAAPNLTEAERTARFQTVVRGTMELQPTDPTQTMLASLILGHHLAIMDGFRDIACLTLTPAEAARARMVTVAQTKLVLQLARELRIARKDTQTQTAADQTTAEQTAAERGEPAPTPAGDAGYQAPLAKLLSAYTETLAKMENTDTLTPTAAAKAREALSQVLSPAPGDTPRAANPVEAHAAPGPATRSRAQRRATMKRRGQFKRTA